MRSAFRLGTSSLGRRGCSAGTAPLRRRWKAHKLHSGRVTEPPEEEQAVDEGNMLVMTAAHFIVLAEGVAHQHQRKRQQHDLHYLLGQVHYVQVAEYRPSLFLHYY